MPTGVSPVSVQTYGPSPPTCLEAYIVIQIHQPNVMWLGFWSLVSGLHVMTQHHDDIFDYYSVWLRLAQSCSCLINAVRSGIPVPTNDFARPSTGFFILIYRFVRDRRWCAMILQQSGLFFSSPRYLVFRLSVTAFRVISALSQVYFSSRCSRNARVLCDAWITWTVWWILLHGWCCGRTDVRSLLRAWDWRSRQFYWWFVPRGSFFFWGFWSCMV